MFWYGFLFVLMVIVIVRMWRERKHGTPITPTRDPSFDKAEGRPQAAFRNPHDSVTFAIQLRIETYANGSTSDVNALTGKIDATEEANIFAALNHLIHASPKWHGSIEKMWASPTTMPRADPMPPGSPSRRGRISRSGCSA